MALNTEVVKENVSRAAPLSAWWLVGALGATAAALVLVAVADSALPPPLRRGDVPPDRFVAETAYEHLLNLTDIGPRVSGSYENEVLAVGVLVAALKEIARGAAPHNHLELDVFTADGAFPLAFLDGMNHVYHGVSSVVARVSGRGAPPQNKRVALLFNCHFDTVPDSPGASDDGAGCAVLLETARALAAAREPLRHDAVFLFNGAEENVLQASHGFVTRHPWAGSVRAFVNIEACGVGGREVLFQAGPRAPWLVEAYAAAAPRPFASSLAQELFRSGLIPADTDFRVFRDFGNLSGLDLAWSADGYAYHTRLDTAARLPPAALQRTGDNVLALARELVWSEALAHGAARETEGQPVFFDVVGVWAVTLRERAAAAAAATVLALLALHLHITARDARAHLYLSAGAWARAVCGAAAAVGGAALCGVACAVTVALLVVSLARPLAFYSRPWLLLPLYALPALAAAWMVLWAGMARVRAGGAALRGWWAACAVHAACTLWAGGVLAACCVAGLRSGFLPALWAGGGALAGAIGGRGGRGAALGALGAVPGALQTLYLTVPSLRMLVPVAGRAGAGAVPADAAMAALVAALALGGTAWVLPLVAAAGPTRGRAIVAALFACCGAAVALVWATGREAAYSPLTPQRLMVFHTRRTDHTRASVDNFYWVPELDDNTHYTLSRLGGALGGAVPVSEEECARRVWCGAPYYLPVRSLVMRSRAAPAHTPPLVRLHVNMTWEPVPAGWGAGDRLLRVALSGAQHAVVICSPAPGVRLVAAGEGAGAPLEAPRWGARRVYFFALHSARAPHHAPLALRLQAEGTREVPPEGEWAMLSVAGHALFGPHKEAPEHARLLASLPRYVAATGWGVDLHLYSV